MDAIAYAYGDKQSKKIDRFIANPDSTSGVITTPKVIAVGETITIPAGRVAVLPNVQVDGTVNILGEVFVPSGSTYGDLDTQIALKADTSYVDAQVATRSRMVQGTAVNSTSGTSIDFTGIPTWAKKITVMFNGVSTNGASLPILRIGDSSIVSSGYVSSSCQILNGQVSNVTMNGSGFLLWGTWASTYDTNGTIHLTNLSSNVWICNGNIASSFTAQGVVIAGTINLSSSLDRIRITTVSGTDTFDAGQINIMYEG